MELRGGISVVIKDGFTVLSPSDYPYSNKVAVLQARGYGKSEHGRQLLLRAYQRAIRLVSELHGKEA